MQVTLASSDQNDRLSVLDILYLVLSVCLSVCRSSKTKLLLDIEAYWPTFVVLVNSVLYIAFAARAYPAMTLSANKLSWSTLISLAIFSLEDRGFTNIGLYWRMYINWGHKVLVCEGKP